MAKELPWFKFLVSEWTDGDITLEDYEVQGLFINICAYYWSNECEITLKKVRKKFKDAPDESFESLLASEVLKIGLDDLITINFLDEQRDERLKLIDKNTRNGKSGGRPPKSVENTGDLRLYVVRLFDENEEFIKVGVTSTSISRRMGGVPYKYEILIDEIMKYKEALDVEKVCQESINQYKPLIHFGGHTECFEYNNGVLTTINNIITKPKINQNKTEPEPKQKALREDKIIEDKKRKEILKVIALYHQFCPNLPKVKKPTDSRKNSIRLRIKEHGLQDVVTVLQMAGESKFMNGENKNNWKANFDWILNTNNFVKVLEGNYSNKSHGQSSSSTEEPKINRQTASTVQQNSQNW